MTDKTSAKNKTPAKPKLNKDGFIPGASVTDAERVKVELARKNG